MAKVMKGKVISTSMKNTVIVGVIRKTPHPLYRKLLTRTKKYKVDTNNQTVTVGDIVTIIETKPISKDKHFKLMEKKS